MPERYFQKFPLTVYSNTVCTNITKRVAIDSAISNDPSLYHKVTLKNSIRADLVADRYYEDSFFDWLIYLNNGIIDPYYGWYLNDAEFNDYIIKEYGSIEKAQKKIIYYQLNWFLDDSEMKPSFYDNVLPKALKKYYTPVFADNTRVLYYTRKKEDIITNTNKILDLTISYSNSNQFEVGEIVDIKSNTAPITIGGGEVIFANTSVVKIKNVSGNTSATNIITGEDSNAQGTILTSELSPGSENLSDDEFVYWTPVYYYDYEVQQNEKNKYIKLLDSSRSVEVAENVRVALKQ